MNYDIALGWMPNIIPLGGSWAELSSVIHRLETFDCEKYLKNVGWLFEDLNIREIE